MLSHRLVVRIVCVLLATIFSIPVARAQSTASGVSRNFNPAISVNTLLLGQLAEVSPSRHVNGVDLQESEVQFTSMVDPFWRADLVLGMHPAHEGEGLETDLEIVRVSGQAIPGGFGLVAGRDYLPFGKHAGLHTHQYPFVDAPAAVSTFLGDHSLTETGLQLSHELPLPWYADSMVYGVDGSSEIFDAESRDPVYGGRITNLFDLNEESTFEFGGSYLHGRMTPGYFLAPGFPGVDGALDIYGIDLTFKRVSARTSAGAAFTLAGELILPRPEGGPDDPWGWYAIGQYRFSRNWWIGCSFGGLDRGISQELADELALYELEQAEEAEHGHDESEMADWRRSFEAKTNLTWAPSEFSSVRLEVARYEDLNSDRHETLLSLQMNFTIGSHPAHLY